MSPSNEQSPTAPEHEHGQITGASPVSSTAANANDEQSARWQRAKFIFRALEVRLRFIAIFVVIGLLMAYWDTLESYWERWTRPAATAAAEGDTEYYCPMHPNVIRPGLEPNGAVPSCPICGMPLSLRQKGEAPELPEGVLSRVQLSPERVQLAGVKTATANYMPLTKEVRTVGYVQYDESRLSEIVSRVAGYVEQLFVNKTYESVDAGQPLAEIYSPDLYSGVQELLLAQKHEATDLVASARQRLKLLGVDDVELDEALDTGDAGSRLVIRSPLAGQVIAKNIVEGAAVESGAVLFKVADVSTVWIEADVYERDLPFLAEGQEIEATVEALPGKVFPGHVAIVYPQLSAETRTNRIRVEVDNPDLLLRPGMFATVLVQTSMSETEPFKSQMARREASPGLTDDAQLAALQKVCPVTGRELGSMGDPVKVSVGERTVFLCCSGCEEQFLADPNAFLTRLAPPPAGAVLSVPEQAVIDTGNRTIVYVEREPGMFEGVAVELGPRAGGYYPVISGLTAGDRVAAAGSFLLDAETRLNPAAASAYFGASGGPSEGAGTSTGAVTRKDTSGGKQTLTAAHLKQIEKLAPADRELAIAQMKCPVTDEPLGSMGTPLKMTLDGETVFLCCQGCEAQAKEQSQETLAKVKKLKDAAAKAAGWGESAPQPPVHQH